MYCTRCNSSTDCNEWYHSQQKTEIPVQFFSSSKHRAVGKESGNTNRIERFIMPLPEFEPPYGNHPI